MAGGDIRHRQPDQRLKSAIRRKQRVSLTFAAGLCLLFFGLVLIIGFAPSLLSPRLGGSVITLYVVVSACLIVLVCLLMNLFVAVKLRDGHEDLRKILETGRRPE